MEKRKKEEQKAGSPAWMATFSDLMTQVLVFFVFLFTMSSINEEKFRELLISFRGSFGVIASNVEFAEKTSLPQDDIYDAASSLEEKQFEAMMEDMAAYIQEEGLSDDVHVDRIEEGVVISLTDKLVFPSGKADIDSRAMPVLEEIAGALKKMPNAIRIEGHTDDVPISTPEYPSNWELSVGRSMHVARYLMDVQGILPKRIVVAGYSQYKSVVPNTSAGNRQRNRRVDILVLRESL